MHMKKGFLLIGALSLIACAAISMFLFREDAGMKVLRVPNTQTESYDNVCVDISKNKNGFYSVTGDVEIHYINGTVDSISIHDPTLYAFQVSSAHKGGIWVMDMDEGEAMKQEFSDIAASLRSCGKTELAQRVEKEMDRLAKSGPFTQAST